MSSFYLCNTTQVCQLKLTGSFHDTNTAPCVKRWVLFIVTGYSLCFFLFLCNTHRFIYEWKYSSDYPLLPTADELCTLFNWLCVSFNFLTAWSAGSIGSSKVSFDFALCLVSCFTRGPMVCCRTPSRTSFLCVLKENKCIFTCSNLQSPTIFLLWQRKGKMPLPLQCGSL